MCPPTIQPTQKNPRRLGNKSLFRMFSKNGLQAHQILDFLWGYEWEIDKYDKFYFILNLLLFYLENFYYILLIDFLCYIWRYFNWYMCVRVCLFSEWWGGDKKVTDKGYASEKFPPLPTLSSQSCLIKPILFITRILINLTSKKETYSISLSTKKKAK